MLWESTVCRMKIIIPLDLVNYHLWAGGPQGTDEMSLFFVEPLHYYGPEYFADPRRFYFSNDSSLCRRWNRGS